MARMATWRRSLPADGGFSIVRWSLWKGLQRGGGGGDGVLVVLNMAKNDRPTTEQQPNGSIPPQRPGWQADAVTQGPRVPSRTCLLL